MSAVKKIDLVSTIASETGLTATDTKIIIDAVIESLSDTLLAGNTVELRGFGTFNIVERGARKARNINTGESLDVASRKYITMKPCQSMKNLINSSLSSSQHTE